MTGRLGLHELALIYGKAVRGCRFVPYIYILGNKATDGTYGSIYW